MNKILLIISCCICLFSCQTADNQADNDKLLVVCTTGMIGDLVQNITGDLADVQSIMGPGVDPHLYKASHGDLTLLRSADIIFYNGLHLEGKMQEIFEQIAKTKPVFAITNALTIDELKAVDESDDSHDPHIWFDVSLWTKTTELVAGSLIELDSVNEEAYTSNKTNYNQQLSELHSWVTSQMELIPIDKRILITSHDAFGYFGRAYDIKVKGLQGISTTTEFGLKDVGDMVDEIVENKIAAVFVESTISERSLNAVVEGCKAKRYSVAIGGTLYSDAMGEEGTDAGN
ncbi:MAG: zinc ABC transporter substrate-binding protein, partial [Bacteroidia bacterium]|nr:zinc ABC transporter substrate-binding protein [Bacteroidia bacterium]